MREQLSMLAAAPAEMKRSAEISLCLKYRYSLARECGAWRRELGHTLLLLQDDPEPLRAELARIYVATEAPVARR